MSREPEFLFIKESGVKPEAMVYYCDYCVTPVPNGLRF